MNLFGARFVPALAGNFDFLVACIFARVAAEFFVSRY
jgi:hypothetical protein